MHAVACNPFPIFKGDVALHQGHPEVRKSRSGSTTPPNRTLRGSCYCRKLNQRVSEGTTSWCGADI